MVNFLCFYILSGVNMTLIQVVLIFYNISFFNVRLYHFQVNCNRKSDLNTLYILYFQRLCNRNLVPNKNRHVEYPSHQEEKVLPGFQIHSVLYTLEKTMFLINCHSCHKVEGSFDSFMNINKRKFPTITYGKQEILFFTFHVVVKCICKDV